MTDDEAWRLMELFRKYRDNDELHPEEREEFKRLGEKHRAWKEQGKKDEWTTGTTTG